MFGQVQRPLLLRQVTLAGVGRKRAGTIRCTGALCRNSRQRSRQEIRRRRRGPRKTGCGSRGFRQLQVSEGLPAAAGDVMGACEACRETV
jgi:hypothetical protein